MRTLLDLLLVAALLALVASVSVGLLIRHAFRRLRRAARGAIGAARLNRPLGVASRPSDRQVGAWQLSPLRAPADLVAARILGPAVSARAYLPTAAGTVARVHRDLHRDVTATSRALRAARRAGRPEDGLERSVVGLVRLARELQLDLRIVAAEPDRRVRARMLAEQATRATVIHRACAQVRTALLEERTGTHEAALQRIVEDVNDAVTAVSLRARARARAYRELSHL